MTRLAAFARRPWVDATLSILAVVALALAVCEFGFAFGWLMAAMDADA